jgi:hypothetical protein
MRRFSSIALVAAASAVSSCNDVSDDVAEEQGREELAPLADQPFIVHPSLKGSLMKKVLASSGGIRVCLRGSGVNNSTRDGYKAQVRNAMTAWVHAMRPVSSVPLLKVDDSMVKFDCTGSADLTVNWSWRAHSKDPCEPNPTAWDSATGCRRAFVGSDLRSVYLYAAHNNPGAFPYYNIVLHEFGHVFGLGDPYSSDDSGFSVCDPGQRDSLMCDVEVAGLRTDDRAGIQEAFCAVFPDQCKLRFAKDYDFCTGATEAVHLADFNNDGRTDVLCHDRASGHQRVLLSTGTGFRDGTADGLSNTTEAFCDAKLDTLHVTDFDGNGRADLVCHQGRYPGALKVSLVGKGGSFGATTMSQPLEYCLAPSTLHFGRFNNDNRADFLCIAPGGGPVLVLQSESGLFEGAIWATTEFCTENKAGPFLRDFDGDGLTDALCVGASSSTLALASLSKVELNPAWTREKSCEYGQLRAVGRFDSDVTADLLCRNPDSAETFVELSFGKDWFRGYSRFWELDWCRGSGDTLLAGDFNGNGRDELLCHERATGTLRIAYPATGEETSRGSSP